MATGEQTTREQKRQIKTQKSKSKSRKRRRHQNKFNSKWDEDWDEGSDKELESEEDDDYWLFGDLDLWDEDMIGPHYDNDYLTIDIPEEVDPIESESEDEEDYDEYVNNNDIYLDIDEEEDENEVSVPVCYICVDGINESPQLVDQCVCADDLSRVHEECLLKYLHIRFRDMHCKYSDKLVCPNCKTRYSCLRVNVDWRCLDWISWGVLFSTITFTIMAWIGGL